MRRNNGVIGQKKLNSKNSATGIFDLYDQSNGQFDLKWPQTKKYYTSSLTTTDAAGASSFQIIQNGTITLTMRFTGYEVGDSVYIYLQPSTNYVTGTYSSVYDFTGNKVLSASGLGNGITETTFNMQVRPNGGTNTIYWLAYAYTDSSRTRFLGSVGTFSALPPNGVINSTYSILNESASPNTDTPTVTISYVKNNISVWKTWGGTASLTTDVSGASTSNRTQTWSTGVAYSWDTITVLNDRLTESQETLIMYLRYANSVGHILDTKTWTINDDSRTWSAIVSESGNTMSETTSIGVETVNAGKLHVFNSTDATLLRTIDNPNDYDTAEDDLFGHSVAIDGDYAIVGAYGEDDAGGLSSGKAYIFNVTTGALLHTLDNPNVYDTSVNDNFGKSVGISGNYCIVSAINEDAVSANNSGKAYIFDVTTGALLHTLDNPDVLAGDQFGTSVSISGNYAIVGTPLDDNGGNFNSGKAYIFNVTTGVLLHTLINPNDYDTTEYDVFGSSVSIDGNYAIVGAYGEDVVGGLNVGRAYIFNVTTGALIHTVNNPNPSAGDVFGSSVAISGNYVIIGAYGKDDAGTDSGKAYIFRIPVPSFSSALLHTIDNPNGYDTATGDQFGTSVSISGNYAIVGANTEDDINGTDSGKAYIYNVTTGALVYTLDNPNPEGTSANDHFGISVAISGNNAIVSAQLEDIVGGAGVDQLRSKGLTGNQGFTMNVLTHNKDMTSLTATLSIPAGFNPSPGILQPAGTRYYWSDWGGDIFDSWGNFYIYDPISGTASLITFSSLNGLDGTVYTESQTHHGKTFTIKHGWVTQGIFKLDVECEDVTFNFSIGMYGNMGSDSNTQNSDRTYSASWGNLNYNYNSQLNTSEFFFTHFIPKIKSFNDGITNSGSNFTTNFFTSVSGSDNLAQWSDPLIVGATMYFVKGSNSTTGANYDWVANDIEIQSGSALDLGKAYIFKTTTGDWTDTSLSYTLNNPSTSENAQFGQVAISGDYVIVGVKLADGVSTDSGKAYIFNIATGTLVHTLDNPNASLNDYFGNSVAIDGNYAIVGAYLEGGAGEPSDSGKAYIFNVTTGALVHTLDNPGASNSGFDDNFGISVGISGNYAIVGAYLEQGQVGKAYVFNVTTGSLLYTFDHPRAASWSRFGGKVIVSDNYAVVATESDNPLVLNYVFVYNLVAGNPIAELELPNDQYPTIAISDGRLIIGIKDVAVGGLTQAGQVKIFDIDGLTVTPTDISSPTFTLNNPNAIATSDGDNFGYSVAMDGNYAIVSAYNEDDAGGTSSGKAYLYKTTYGEWTDTTLLNTLDNPNDYGTSANDLFGYSVAISGNNMIVSATGDSFYQPGGGNSITFTVSTEYADVNPPTIDWDLEFLSSVTGLPYFANTDLLPFETSGTLTLTNNVGSITVFANNDLLTEGDETFRLRVFDDIGNIIANSNVITILDTSTGDNEYVAPLDGQIAFTVAGTTNWVVPNGVTSVSAVCVGGGGGGASSTLATNGRSGGGGGGGALHWRTFSVTPGETLTVVVGAAGTGGTAAANDNATNGGESAILRTAEYLVRAAGGAKGPYNSIGNLGTSAQSYFSTIGGGGGNGGLSSGGSNGNVSGGGGGAGGYSGNGGNGQVYNVRASTPGLGGGGSGAQGVNGYTVTITWGAGGVDIYGEGTSGTQVPGTTRTNTAFTNDPTDQAQAGSYAVDTFTMTYGGGGSGAEDDSGAGGATGGQGAVRIIWGPGRSYPSTSTADV